MKTRIVEADGRFTPEWKMPIFPIWFEWCGYYGNTISFKTLKEARDWLDAPDSKKRIHNHHDI